jgi:hypothetical protein
VIHHVINNLNVRWLVQVLSLLICPNVPVTIILGQCLLTAMPFN